MKILIINPPSPDFITTREKRLLLGPLYLLSALRTKGFSVNYIDAENEKICRGDNYDLREHLDELQQRIEDFKPDVVGFSLHFSGILESSIQLAEKIKHGNSSIQVVFGGHHPTAFAASLMSQYSFVDFILKGESEESFPQLMECLHQRKDYSSIDGLVFRLGGEIIENDKVHFIQDIDLIVPPAYDMVNLDDYRFDTTGWFNPKGHTINYSMPLLTSRSCPNRCSFCSMYLMQGERYRMRSATSVVDELEHLYHRYGQRYFSITDDNFTLNKSRVLQIADDVLRRGLDIQFDAVNGIAMNNIDREVLDALVRMGFIRTFFAVESGSEFIRMKCMKKKLTQEKVYEVFDLVRQYKQIQYTVLFIIGFPEETRETLQETYNLIQKYDFKKVAIGFAIPYPGTELYKQALRDNLFTVPLEQLHAFPSLYNFSKTPLLRPYSLDPSELVQFREKVYEEFNLRYQQKTNF